MKQPINEIKKMQLLAGLINEVEYNESLWGINKQPLNEATVKDLIKPLVSKLESMGYQVDYDTSFGFMQIEAFKTLPDGSILRMTVVPSDAELQQKNYVGTSDRFSTIDVDFTHWTTQITKKLFGLYKQKTRVMKRLPDDEGNNIDLGTGMFDIPVEQSVDRIISLLKKAEDKAIQMSNNSLNEVDTKEAKADEAVKAEVKPKKATEPKLKELHIDQANPYEYRHGLAHELHQLGEYTDEALEKAKTTVLKNLAKDANFYSNLLNQQQSHYEFKTPESQDEKLSKKLDSGGRMEIKGFKNEKANVKDNLGKKEEGTTKPKGVKIMPDKGVTGSSKTIKEGFEIKQDQDEIEISADSGDYVGEIENGKASFSVFFPDTEQLQDEFGPEGITKDNWKDVLGPNHAFVKIIDTIGGDVEAIDDYVQITVDVDKLVNSNIKEGFQGQFYAPEYLENKYGKETAKKIEAEIDDLDPNSYDRYTGMESAEEVEDYIADIKDMLNIKEGSFMGGADLGSSSDQGNSSIEQQLEKALRSHDWYYQYSDDPREFRKGQDEKYEISSLMKQLPREKAVELYNKYSPKDGKLQNEDKHTKIKEILKKGLKELINPKDIQAAKTTGDVVNIPVQDTAAQTAAKNAKINFRTYK